MKPYESGECCGLPDAYTCRQPFWSYLGSMVTVKELLLLLVSVPTNVAEPVVEMVPACNGTKFTVTTMVCPPGRLARLQVSVPPMALVAIPPQLP